MHGFDGTYGDFLISFHDPYQPFYNQMKHISNQTIEAGVRESKIFFFGAVRMLSNVYKFYFIPARVDFRPCPIYSTWSEYKEESKLIFWKMAINFLLERTTRWCW